MQAPAELRELTKGNLIKTMAELVEEDEVLDVTDPALYQGIVFHPDADGT